MQLDTWVTIFFPFTSCICGFSSLVDQSRLHNCTFEISCFFRRNDLARYTYCVSCIFFRVFPSMCHLRFGKNEERGRRYSQNLSSNVKYTCIVYIKSGNTAFSIIKTRVSVLADSSSSVRFHRRTTFQPVTILAFSRPRDLVHINNPNIRYKSAQRCAQQPHNKQC